MFGKGMPGKVILAGVSSLALALILSASAIGMVSPNQPTPPGPPPPPPPVIFPPPPPPFTPPPIPPSGQPGGPTGPPNSTPEPSSLLLGLVGAAAFGFGLLRKSSPVEDKS